MRRQSQLLKQLLEWLPACIRQPGPSVWAVRVEGLPCLWLAKNGGLHSYSSRDRNTCDGIVVSFRLGWLFRLDCRRGDGDLPCATLDNPALVS